MPAPEPIADRGTARPSGSAVGVDGTPSLIARIARGDTVAFAEFYERWFDRAFDAARAGTRRDESFCLDVVQDSMVRAIKCLRPTLGIRTRDELDRWMGRVVYTTAIDHLRRETRRAARHLAIARRGHGSVGRSRAPATETFERMEWLRGALADLSDEERALVSFRYRGGTLEESGEEAGLTGAAAHGRLRRLLVRLRQAAKEVFDDR
jgi:RNA polymerase sigma-70 factor (ECF subfamily)